MPLISIRLEDNQDKRLQEMMKRSGASKSETIKTILRKYFNQNQILLPATKPAMRPSPEELTQKLKLLPAAPSTPKQPPLTGDPFDESRPKYHRNELPQQGTIGKDIC
ncbi:MAG: CopG family transcriptional regulator [Nitrospirae bacterium]|nr:CopG family transcriptional regulator [Nitrospirota bacterium]